jgi:hypothetical protein
MCEAALFQAVRHTRHNWLNQPDWRCRNIHRPSALTDQKIRMLRVLREQFFQ